MDSPDLPTFLMRIVNQTTAANVRLAMKGRYRKLKMMQNSARNYWTYQKCTLRAFFVMHARDARLKEQHARDQTPINAVKERLVPATRTGTRKGAEGNQENYSTTRLDCTKTGSHQP
ncbi:hypothetical protein MPH_06069 [Macrophomina phaseolina MS6]|uniref:Uncharacterized protein n=1 Tax=Macrophomina phaseolina (strain MS6) TaxID=1126212 RepID=K2RPP5_MACPH|nr:hypothetical protein MPH_06069 [Macrophomina phaseolina MS6]